MLGCGYGFTSFTTELDHALDHRAPEVGISCLAIRGRRARVAGAPSAPSFARLPAPGGSRYRLRLPRVEQSSIEQPVAPILHLEATASGKGPYGSGNSERIGQSRLLANLGRRKLKKLAGLRRSGRDG
jgi:hypothetical protein